MPDRPKDPRVKSTQLLARSCSSKVDDKVTMTNECRDTRKEGMPISRLVRAPPATAQTKVTLESQPRRRVSSALIYAPMPRNAGVASDNSPE